MRRDTLLSLIALTFSLGSAGSEPARILTNHLGYDSFGPKRAVIRGSASDQFQRCTARAYPSGATVFEAETDAGSSVNKWKDWKFWTLNFTGLETGGDYTIECRNKGDNTLVKSMPFRLQSEILERGTLSDLTYYFKSVRATGAIDRADRQIAFSGSNRKPIDARGGWYDASGDYGIHLSQLDFTSYFNTQQVPLVAYSLGKAREILDTRKEPNFAQIRRRLLDETAYGADFLVRIKAPGGSFYAHIYDKSPEKRPEDRRIGRPMLKPLGPGAPKPASGAAELPHEFEAGYRGGGGFAIAALAIAARAPQSGDFSQTVYLKAAEDAFAFLEAHNAELTNDGKENIVDDYCALVAASELARTTKKPVYAVAAQRRAESLLARLVTANGLRDYWLADDRDRPFFHPSDAGAPVVALLGYYELADGATQDRIREVVRRSLQFELWVTGESANPFGLARQYVQSKGGERRTAFFFPHDTETGWWWQGENARLGSLATAVRLAIPLYGNDPAFQTALQSYATDQLNWILGLNPYDASMLTGTGRNNPEYRFFSSWEYKSAPGGICNGITGGLDDDEGIDFQVPYEQTGVDSDWRWGEQWLPHAAWYMLAVASGQTAAAPAEKAIIGYVFTRGRIPDPSTIAAEKLTHINYAFANIRNGEMVEGFENDARTMRVLNGLKQRNPKLKLLVSVGGWTWSNDFSDVALTAESRKKFVASAVAFVERHQLDGLDVDWEFPGQKGNNNVNRPEDKENFTALMADLRSALDEAGRARGKRYLLTIAAQAAPAWIEHTEMSNVAASLDYVNLMAYDQFVGSEPVAAHHAPLFTHPANPKRLSAATAVTQFLAAGVPAEKIVLGVPFYGRAWASVSATNHGLYQPASEARERLGGSFQGIKTRLENKDGFIRYWDDISKAPYLYNAERQLFVSYEDEQSIQFKAQYVKERRLGGMMFWEYSADPENKLLDAINKGLK
ncbi:MAG: glycoside hydrolase family 9 protein [Bryobacterales bacterium]|nr:glycoside hydrolase family 9 protein [Bryobacterales bacterium]